MSGSSSSSSESTNNPSWGEVQDENNMDKVVSRAATATVRVLCFGDSLTSGYHANGMLHDPYSDTLEEMLAAQYASAA